MERITKDHFGRRSIFDEHMHRYRLAAMVSRGVTVDCACGVGYGSAILAHQVQVTHYIGIDPNDDAITFANSHFGGERISFETGTLEKNSCAANSVDTCVVIETLEHTNDPSIALAGISRILKPDGLLIGSVPSLEYEMLCEQTYGHNPFHLSRFSTDDIVRLLSGRFGFVHLYSAEFLLGTLIRDVTGRSGSVGEILPDETVRSIHGSIFFMAGSAERVSRAITDIGPVPKFFASQSKAVIDREEVEPIRVAFNRTEELVRDRDKRIARTDELVQLKDARIASTEELVRQRDARITSIEELLRQRDSEIAQNQLTILQAATVGSHYRELLVDLTHQGQTPVEAVMRGRRNNAPFADMALTLYLFSVRLYEEVIRLGVKDLFFCAREGQILQKMFDYLQQINTHNPRIRSHYIRVSRRSTFLPSLGPLHEETFEALFRQYRRISLHDFLKSIGLEAYSKQIAANAMLSEHDMATQCDDLPTDTKFRRLLDSSFFQSTYERERTSRRTAFGLYLKSFFPDSELPPTLHIVDVGWKGTIQDNLSAILSRLDLATKEVCGWYIGLIANGSAGASNRKAGLLFSCIDGVTPGFHVFNENRSLFEIILHADHGSAACFVVDAEGSPAVAEDANTDSEMILTSVKPISDAVLSKFYKIALAGSIQAISPHDLYLLVRKYHERMVFDPTREELEWIGTIKHTENFGVFGDSTFASPTRVISFLARLRDTALLILSLGRRDLGFWPWLYLKVHILAPAASVYSAYRRIQR